MIQKNFFLFLIFMASFLSSYAYASNDQELLLDKVESSAFQYFQKEVHPQTGLVYDSASNHKGGLTQHQASVAATGFGLTALGVGVERGWIDRAEAKSKVRKTLEFFLTQAEGEHGFYYHFLDPKNGKRSAKSELSPIDTALFLAGVIFVTEYFEDPQIRDLAEKILDRIDWPWMLNGGKTFALAWSPEHGFSKRRWDHFDESLLLYILALGSPLHPISAESWKALARPVGSYQGHRLIQMPPLFTHQYPHLWIDFRNKNDGYADYFENSRQASLAHRQFAMDQSSRFTTYGMNTWGFTASNGPFGYKAYGAPPGWPTHDGTIAPTGCLTSMMFTPKESKACLQHLYERYQDSLWGDYGFSDAFNLDKHWFDDRVIAIDQGAILLGIENSRSELIWKTTSRSSIIKTGLDAAGFKSGTMALPWPAPPEYHVPYLFGGIQIDGFLRDWPNVQPIHLDVKNLESGQVDDDQDLSGDIWFGWNETGLFFAAKIRDQFLTLRRNGKSIWQDDCFELFVDPEKNGLYWDRKNDFQIGFRPNREGEEVEVWSWFWMEEDPSRTGQVYARSFSDASGYLIEGMIRWKYLNVEPRAGLSLSATPAIHDVDPDRDEAKMSWFFRNEDTEKRFILGTLILDQDRVRQPTDGTTEEIS